MLRVVVNVGIGDVTHSQKLNVAHSFQYKPHRHQGSDSREGM